MIHLETLVLRPEFDRQQGQGEQEPAFVSREEAGSATQADPGTVPATGGPRPSAQDECMNTLPWMLGMVAIFYFLLIRPQQKQEKKRRAMLSAVVEGDKVVTSGGIHGTISSLGEETVTLRVDPKLKLTIDRQNIARVLGGDKGEKKAENNGAA